MTEGDPKASPTPPPTPPQPLAYQALGLLALVVGTVLVSINQGRPTTAFGWVQLVIGALFIGWRQVKVVYQTFRAGGRGGRTAEWLRDQYKVLAGLLAVVLLAGFAGPPLWDRARGLSYGVLGCPTATQVRMVAEPETITTAREVAADYERATAEDDHGCPTVRVSVFEATAATIAKRLGSADGWSDTSGALQQIGPQPDVWLASTGREVAALRPGTAPVGTPLPVARSPLVLAVPAPAEQPGLTWPELFRRYTDGGPGVERPNPSSGELGQLANALLYGPEAADPSDPAALSPGEVEQGVDSVLDEAGRPIGDAAALLCRRRALPPEVSVAALPAIIASEQDVARYNAGRPLGGSCGSAAEPDDARRLTAVYPTDTAGQELQFVPLAWKDASGGSAQRASVTEFGGWLGGEAGRGALVRAGLRPVEQTGYQDPLTPRYGVDPEQYPTAEPLPTDRLARAGARYATSQRPSRLLFLIDTSGSMRTTERVPGPTPTDERETTRAGAAAEAVRAGLSRLGPRDEFGLWYFPGGTRASYSPVVDVGPRTDARFTAAGQALAGIAPAGDTPLYRAMVDGAAELTREGGDIGVRALVVLTDGEDTNSGIAAADAAKDVRDRGVRIVVVTLGDVRCAGGDLPVVVGATGGDCQDADASTVGERVPEAVARVRGGG